MQTFTILASAVPEILLGCQNLVGHMIPTMPLLTVIVVLMLAFNVAYMHAKFDQTCLAIPDIWLVPTKI